MVASESASVASQSDAVSMRSRSMCRVGVSPKTWKKRRRNCRSLKPIRSANAKDDRSAVRLSDAQAMSSTPPLFLSGQGSALPLPVEAGYWVFAPDD